MDCGGGFQARRKGAFETGDKLAFLALVLAVIRLRAEGAKMQVCIKKKVIGNYQRAE